MVKISKPSRTIIIKGKRFYRYNIYSDWKEAKKWAKYFRKKNGSRYFIQTYEAGYFFPDKRYALYLNKVVSLV